MVTNRLPTQRGAPRANAFQQIRPARETASNGVPLSITPARRALSAEQISPRGSRRQSDFGAHLEATRGLVGYAAQDEWWVAASREAIAPHIGSIVLETFDGLVTDPRTASMFINRSGAFDAELLVTHRHAFQTWLCAVINDPLDALTAAHLAAVVHAEIRPRKQGGETMKGRQFVACVSYVETGVLRILGDLFPDAGEFVAASSAWSKRLMIHLDLVLYVFSVTGKSPRWY